MNRKLTKEEKKLLILQNFLIDTFGHVQMEHHNGFVTFENPRFNMRSICINAGNISNVCDMATYDDCTQSLYVFFDKRKFMIDKMQHNVVDLKQIHYIYGQLIKAMIYKGKVKNDER